MVSSKRSSSKKPRKRPSLVSCFKKCCKEFCVSTSLDGCKYMVTCKTIHERNLWKIIQFFTIALLVYLTLHAWEKFMTTPVITALESTDYAVQQVNFPGISICSVNKLDRRRVEDLAGRLGELNLVESLRLLGTFYDYSSAKENEASLIRLEGILDRHFGINGTTVRFDPFELLKELITPCSEMLLYCVWAGEEHPCMDLFVMETTMEGFCCLFNYVPPQRAELPKIVKDNGGEILKSEGMGIEMGLTVHVATDEEAYMYPLISTIGTNVHVFESADFPDTTSGNLYERIVPVNVEAYIRLDSSTVYTLPEARKYSREKRNCIFENEQTTIFGGYSFSDCIMNCKIDSMLALCQCIPFVLYRRFGGNEDNYQCTLSDLMCLEKYQEKWNTLYPKGYKGDELKREQENSIRCEDCMPRCSDTLYSVKTDYGHIAKPGNFSAIHIFFQSASGDLLKQDVLYYWFDIISLFGGTFSVVLGVSLVSIAEFFYFFVYRFCVLKCTKRQQK